MGSKCDSVLAREFLVGIGEGAESRESGGRGRSGRAAEEETDEEIDKADEADALHVTTGAAEAFGESVGIFHSDDNALTHDGAAADAEGIELAGEKERVVAVGGERRKRLLRLGGEIDRLQQDAVFIAEAQDLLALENDGAMSLQSDVAHMTADAVADGIQTNAGNVEAHIVSGLGDLAERGRGIRGTRALPDALVGALVALHTDDSVAAHDEALSDIETGDAAGEGETVLSLLHLFWGWRRTGEESGGRQEILHERRRGEYLPAALLLGVATDGAENCMRVAAVHGSKQAARRGIRPHRVDTGGFDLTRHHHMSHSLLAKEITRFLHRPYTEGTEHIAKRREIASHRTAETGANDPNTGATGALSHHEGVLPCTGQ